MSAFSNPQGPLTLVKDFLQDFWNQKVGGEGGLDAFGSKQNRIIKNLHQAEQSRSEAKNHFF